MEPDFLDVLFNGGLTEEQVMQGQAAMAAKLQQERAERAARLAAEVARRCPKCGGEGRIAQFSHRKGGECFLCGGSGVFAGYRAI